MNLTVPIWATKGIEFWTLLSMILLRARPENLLEFGGGRSSTLLADYAHRFRKTYFCIEQSEHWAEKIRSDLRHMGIGSSGIRHAPVVPMPKGPNWYDPEQVRSVIGDHAFDLVFVDGPSGGGRNSPAGCDIIAHAARSARLAIVDDLQRPVCLKFFDRLAGRSPPHAQFYFIYRNQAIGLVSEPWAPIVSQSFDFLGLRAADRAEVDELAADPANA